MIFLFVYFDFHRTGIYFLPQSPLIKGCVIRCNPVLQWFLVLNTLDKKVMGSHLWTQSYIRMSLTFSQSLDECDMKIYIFIF